jgi:hypothetical protein
MQTAAARLGPGAWESQWEVNDLVQRHFGSNNTAHSLRASFVTVAVEAGQCNNAIKNQIKQNTSLS